MRLCTHLVEYKEGDFSKCHHIRLLPLRCWSWNRAAATRQQPLQLVYLVVSNQGRRHQSGWSGFNRTTFFLQALYDVHGSIDERSTGSTELAAQVPSLVPRLREILGTRLYFNFVLCHRCDRAKPGAGELAS